MKSYTKEQNISIPLALDEKIESLAAAYRDATGDTLHVTSGYRSPYSQAVAMYDNEKHNRGVKYAKVAAYNEIKKAFEAGFNASGYPAAITTDDMKRVIDDQILRGVFISAHLTGSAADFRKGIDMAALGTICQKRGDFVMEEQHCVHITFA